MGKEAKPRPRPVPWLVGWSDLRRYLGRALDACERGRVVFFVRPGGRQMYALAPEDAEPLVVWTARCDMDRGWYRRVVLAELPRRRRRAKLCR